MSAKPITKSQAKLESWGEIRALDRLAVPLIREHGIVEAYRMVVGVQSEISTSASRVVKRETGCAGGIER